MRFCIACRLRRFPDRDVWGEEMPSCECRRPVTVALGFNPAAGRLTVTPEERAVGSQEPGQMELEAA